MLLDLNCVTVSVLLSFLTVTWVCLQCMIVVFPGHTHLPFLSEPLFLYKIYALHTGNVDALFL